MLCESIYLRESEGDMSVRLDTYVCAREGDMCCNPRDAVVVLPGGAYCFLAAREAEPVAKAFLAHSFNVFVLYYSLNEKAAFPRPVVDVSMALAHIRNNAEKYNVNPDRIFVCGFSAGGHLAGSIGTFWNRDWAGFDGMEKGINRPTGVILSYPASSLMDFGHRECACTICGCAEPTDEQKKAYSLELQVTDDTVPHFVWQTQFDECVPIENSLLLVNALIAKKIPTEFHIYPKGPHGMSVATSEVYWHAPEAVNMHVAKWLDAAVEWTKLV